MCTTTNLPLISSPKMLDDLKKSPPIFGFHAVFWCLFVSPHLVPERTPVHRKPTTIIIIILLLLLLRPCLSLLLFLDFGKFLGIFYTLSTHSIILVVFCHFSLFFIPSSEFHPAASFIYLVPKISNAFSSTILLNHHCRLLCFASSAFGMR